MSVFVAPGCLQRPQQHGSKRSPRVTGNLKRDAAAGTKFWRGGADLLAKLPKKTVRNVRTAVRGGSHPVRLSPFARRISSTRHAETIYRKLTKNLGVYTRVDDLVYDAGEVSAWLDTDPRGKSMPKAH